MYQAIVLLPLLGFLIAGLFGRAIGAKASEYVTSGLVILAATLSWVGFITFGMGDGEPIRITLLQWVQSGSLSFDWSLRIDRLTLIMLVVINTVSALVHVYSIGYMHLSLIHI